MGTIQYYLLLLYLGNVVKAHSSLQKMNNEGALADFSAPCENKKLPRPALLVLVLRPRYFLRLTHSSCLGDFLAFGKNYRCACPGLRTGGELNQVCIEISRRGGRACSLAKLRRRSFVTSRVSPYTRSDKGALLLVLCTRVSPTSDE